MPVAATDVEMRFTIPGAGAGDTTPGTSAGSLGEYVSTTQMVSGTLHNLFDAVSGAENAASDVEYRCFAVCNTNGTDTWSAVQFWIESQVSGGAALAVGLDPAGVVDTNLASAQGEVVVDESTAPTGVTFTTPSETSRLTIGDIPPGDCQLVWLRRTAANTSSLTYDGATLRFSGGDT